MATTAAIAAGPIEFTFAGEQVVLPLEFLYFDASGALKADLWPSYPAYKSTLDNWLLYLRRNGFVTPAPQPPPAAAMVIAATDAGSTGNDIAIAFTNVDPAAGTFDAALTQTDVYAGLTPDTVAAVLGTAPGEGTRPGLVYVSSSGAPTQPKNGSQSLSSSSPHTADIPGSGGTAFTVQSRADDDEAKNTTVEISAADDAASPDTFTLTATWTKQATGLQPGDLQAAFEYEIVVTAPPGGQLLPPAPGTVALRGGSDAAAPTTASATVTAQ